jgi:hypothetical protein
MRPSRLLAGILLLISGILHLDTYFEAPDSPGSIHVLSFGVIYMITGFLLFNKKSIRFTCDNCFINRDDTFPDKIRYPRFYFFVRLI